MKQLKEIVPDVSDLVALEPEEIGFVILQMLGSANGDERSILNTNNFMIDPGLRAYSQQRHADVQKVLMEGWVWLESEGLIARDPEQTANWVFITRRGRRLVDRKAFTEYRSTSALKKELLHPRIAEKAWSSYLRGEYDTAVFIAFKEVEIVVRELSSQKPEMVGTDLMRNAFGSNGKLAATELPKAEQESLAHLFAGAMGWFKNPQSHRNVGLGHVSYAVQSLMFASHLLSLAEFRSLV